MHLIAKSSTFSAKCIAHKLTCDFNLTWGSHSQSLVKFSFTSPTCACPQIEFGPRSRVFKHQPRYLEVSLVMGPHCFLIRCSCPRLSGESLSGPKALLLASLCVWEVRLFGETGVLYYKPPLRVPFHWQLPLSPNPPPFPLFFFFLFWGTCLPFLLMLPE